jgi:hypothetical protein
MTAPQVLFWANILILVPIGFGTLLKPSLTDHGVFAESAGWRTLVGSLWLAILALSVLGVRQPEAFLWLLAFQVFYKSVWLLAYVMPRLLTGRRSEIPPPHAELRRHRPRLALVHSLGPAVRRALISRAAPAYG